MAPAKIYQAAFYSLPAVARAKYLKVSMDEVLAYATWRADRIDSGEITSFLTELMFYRVIYVMYLSSHTLSLVALV